MSLEGKIARGEKWLKIYNDSDIAKNKVMLEDVKAFKNAMETDTMPKEKELEKMDMVELNKYIHRKALDFGDDQPAIKKADLIKQIRELEK